MWGLRMPQLNARTPHLCPHPPTRPHLHPLAGGSCDLLVQSMEPPAAPGASPAEVAAAQRDAAALAGRTAAALGAQELILWQPSALFLNTPAASDPAHPERVLR